MEITKYPYVVEVVCLKHPFFLELWSDHTVTWLQAPPQLKVVGQKSKRKRRKKNGRSASKDSPGRSDQGSQGQ